MTPASRFARVNNRGTYARERAILKLLRQALDEIQEELRAASADEVAINPILKSKQRFVDQARARVAAWEQK